MDKLLGSYDWISIEHLIMENLINAYYVVGSFKDDKTFEWQVDTGVHLKN